MSIKKEVLLRSEIMTIYSSEMQERMKVYFELQEQYAECKNVCTSRNAGEDQYCEKLCSEVFNDYAKRLFERYKDQPEKINDVVTNSPLFETKPRDHTKTLWYTLFGS